MNLQKESLGEVKIITSLRGIAALGVVLFHMTLPNKYLTTLSFPNLIKWFGDEGERLFWLGEYGVEIFFVISGFILPYSLIRSKYNLSHFPKFISKRYVRIALPYFVAIVLNWLFLFIVPKYFDHIFISDFGKFTIQSL